MQNKYHLLKGIIKKFQFSYEKFHNTYTDKRHNKNDNKNREQDAERAMSNHVKQTLGNCYSLYGIMVQIYHWHYNLLILYNVLPKTTRAHDMFSLSFSEQKNLLPENTVFRWCRSFGRLFSDGEIHTNFLFFFLILVSRYKRHNKNGNVLLPDTLIFTFFNSFVSICNV